MDLGGRYTEWPAAASGWSNVNEMTYLDRNADVMHNADAVITAYAEDDLIVPAVWPGYYIFHDHKTWILTVYIFIRSVLYRLRVARVAFLNFDSTPTGMPDEAQLQRFKELVASVAKEHKMVIFIYPTLKNLQNKSAWLEVIAPREGLGRTTMAKYVDSSRTGLERKSVYKRRPPPDSGRN